MEAVELHMEEESLQIMEHQVEDMEPQVVVMELLQVDMEPLVLVMVPQVLDMTAQALDMIAPVLAMTLQALDQDLTPAPGTQPPSLATARDQQIFCLKNRKISPMVSFTHIPLNLPWKDLYYPTYYLYNKQLIMLLPCSIN